MAETNGKKAPSTFYELQVMQKEHDVQHHPDIYYLSYPERMRHFVLHYAKYVGRLSRGPDSAGETDEAVLEKTLADTFIVTLAASDVLNLNLDNAMQEMFGEPGTAGLAGWGELLEVGDEGMEAEELRDWWLNRLALPTGYMAKALEALDHMEALNVREVLTEGVLEVLSSVVIVAKQMDIDLAKLAETRWDEIEKRRLL